MESRVRNQRFKHWTDALCKLGKKVDKEGGNAREEVKKEWKGGRMEGRKEKRKEEWREGVYMYVQQ